jgi:hypothetical protein
VSAKSRNRWAHGRNHLQAEQIRQEFRKPILGQKVIVEQIDHKGADPRTILSDAVTPSGNSADVMVW